MTTRPRSRPFHGWRVLSVAAMAIFLSGPGQTYGVSVFIDPMIAELGWSRSLVSSIYSAATLMSAVAMFFVGRLIDRIGQRAVLVMAAIGFALALLLASSASSPLVLLAGFALMRTCGSGMLGLTGKTIVPQWFVRRRGRAFSVLGISADMSLAAVPPFSVLLIGLVGWRAAWRIEAMIILLVLVPSALLLVRNRPEDVGQYPDGERPDQAVEAHSTGRDNESWTLAQARRHRAFWLLLGASMVPSLVGTGLSFFQVSVFTERGLPVGIAATTFAVESGVALPMTVLAGWLVERVPSRLVMATAQALLAAAVLILIFADSVELALLHAAFRGAYSGLWWVAADVTWPSYFGRRYLGSIRGTAFAASIAGAALGPLPLGLAYDAFGSYQQALVGLLVLPLLAIVAVLLANKPDAPPIEATAA